jgi:hypothetical protein
MTTVPENAALPRPATQAPAPVAVRRAHAGCGCGCGTGKAPPVDLAQPAAPAQGGCCGRNQGERS